MEETPLSMDAIVAAASPDSIALLALGATPLRYRDLAVRMSSVAGALRSAGIRREDRVALIFPDGIDLAIAFLGIASAAVCAPLNPAYSVPEFKSYLAGLEVRAAMVAPERPNAIAALHQLDIPIIGFPRFDQPVEIESAAEPANPDDVALILQTSGTTSRPKVVPLTHRNLCVSAANVARVLDLKASDRSLEIMPLFHIHGIVAGLLAPLISGGSVACSPGFSAARFFDCLDEFQPTWYTAVPTMHQAILARSELHRDVIERRRMRLIRSSSAALPPSVLENLERTFGVPVVEAYGMTEAAHQMASNLPAARKPGTVGFAAGPEVAIMDEEGSILEAGVPGEIVIRGDNVTRGYENNAAANEAAFRFGWFHTGDQGFFDPDGYLVISGRIKEIVNRGGEKISPREVDEVLLHHPSVAEAVTFAIPHRQLGEAVGVAVVVRENAVVTEIEIREFAAARLAHFKVPEVVRFVPGIPRAATGKIQRIGMAGKLGIEEIDASEVQPQAPFARANTALEAELTTIWSEILKVSPVGIHDNFFALGGDSLATLVLMTRVAAQTGVEISYVRFLDHPTVADMAAEIGRAKAYGTAKRVTGLVPIQPHGNKPALFSISGHAGFPLAFGNLARFLGPDQPVLMFPPRSLAADAASYSLEQLAAEYIDLMKQHQPQGPYLLAGYCFGGFVAFEMARQLHARSERVDLLALIDTYNPHGGTASLRAATAQNLRHFRERFWMQREAIASKPATDTTKYLAGRVRAFLQQRRFQLEYRAYRLLLRLGRPIPPNLRQPQYAGRHALARYVPKPYDGSAVLLRVHDLRPDAPDMGWTGLMRGGVRILDSPYHNLGPQAESVARVMAEQLRPLLESSESVAKI